MNGDRDVTPERLARLADGAAPRTEAERDAVALMAEVRGLADPAPDAVRERVRAIASTGTAEATRGRRRWLGGGGGDGRRRLALVAAPVAAAVVALAVAIPIATRDDGGSVPPTAADAPAPSLQGAGRDAGGAGGGAAPEAAPLAIAPAAPGTAAGSTATTADALRAAQSQAAPAARAKAAELDRAVGRARATLERAGATGIDARESAGGTAATLVADVPAAQVEATTQALRSQGAQVTAGTEGDDGTAPIRATVTAAD